MKRKANGSLLLPFLGILSFTPVAHATSYLEEILVTAQKREQSAQDIPVSVTAYSGEQLAELGITDAFDLQNTAPGLIVSQNQTATTSNFNIRGIGTGGQNFGLESSVGLYVDGIYRARQSSVINQLVDVEKVQVLRGPQGTLFGRNTPSGAILIDSVKPSHEAGGYVNVTAGNYGLLSIDGAYGGSIIDDVLAFRATIFNADRDGYVEAVGIGEDEVNDRNRSGARFQFAYTPSDVFSARLIVDYSEIDEICCAAVTKQNNFVGFAGQLGTDSLLTLLGGSIVPQSQLEDFRVALNQLPRSSNEDSGISLEMNWDVKGGKLTSITSYRAFDTVDDIDGDFSNVPLFSRVNDAEQDAFSQEVRYTVEGDKLDYVVGGYYFSQELESSTETFSDSLFSSFLLADPTAAGLVSSYNALNSALGGVLPGVANPLPPGSSARNFMSQDHDAFALFGQLDYDLDTDLKLTLGLRYTEESKDLNGRFEQDNTGPLLDLAGLAVGNPSSLVALGFPGWGYAGPITEIGARAGINETLDDDQVTGTIKLTWAPDDEAIYYASYSTGYKSGGTNTDRINPAFDTVFDAETSTTFELGMKRDFPDQNLRLNFTLHYSQTEDLQTNSFAGNGFNLINAGEVEAKGGEFEFWWYPSETLKLSGAFVYNDAEYKSFDSANCQISNFFITGQVDPGAPVVNGVPNLSGGCSRTGEGIQVNPEEVFIVSLTKDFVLADKQAYFHADYNHRSDQLHDGDNDPLKQQDSYGLLNLKAGVFLDDDESTEIALWGRNVTDEFYYLQAFSVPLQTGKVNVYPGEPRTYGISITKKF